MISPVAVYAFADQLAGPSNELKANELKDAASDDRGEDPPRASVRLPSGADLPAGPPGDFWLDFFANNEPSPAAVRIRVRSLSEDELYDHVASLIEAALIHGQSQAWMYEILAMSMELSGRPREEIERVILSLSDFGAANYDSMLQSARYLLTFERREAALTLLKQASVLDADRQDAYLMGLHLVDVTDNVDAAIWVLPGAAKTLWGEGTEQTRAKATKLARRFARSLKRADRSTDADELLKNVNEAAVPDVRVRVEWDGDADLDLVINEPRGTWCTHQSPITSAGGLLLNDGFGPRTTVEEYVCPQGYSGDYLVVVKRSAGSAVGDRARLTIEVRQSDGTVMSTAHVIKLMEAAAPIRLTLPEGRRTLPQQVQNFAPRQPQRVRVAEQSAPVRGGAVGIAPQIGIISEGVQLNAVPVVSPDRRYVRIGLQPWFQNITDVETFSFIGPQNGQ